MFCKYMERLLREAIVLWMQIFNEQMQFGVMQYFCERAQMCCEGTQLFLGGKCKDF